MVEVGRFCRNSVDHVLNWFQFKYSDITAYLSLDPQAQPTGGLSLAQIVQNHYELIILKVS